MWSLWARIFCTLKKKFSFSTVWKIFNFLQKLEIWKNSKPNWNNPLDCETTKNLWSKEEKKPRKVYFFHCSNDEVYRIDSMIVGSYNKFMYSYIFWGLLHLNNRNGYTKHGFEYPLIRNNIILSVNLYLLESFCLLVI